MTYEEMDRRAIPVKWLSDNHFLLENIDGDTTLHLSPYDSSVPKVSVSNAEMDYGKYTDLIQRLKKYSVARQNNLTEEAACAIEELYDITIDVIDRYDRSLKEWELYLPFLQAHGLFDDKGERVPIIDHPDD